MPNAPVSPRIATRSRLDRVRSAARWLDRAWPTVVASELARVDHWEPDEDGAYCPRCGASAGPGSLAPDGCVFCRGTRLPWQRLTRLSLYDEPVDGWLKQMKFGRQWTWGGYFGDRLAERLGEPIRGDRVVVTAVPMHWRRRWRRGFNQAELMAREISRARGWPYLPLLKRQRWTPPQPSVVASQREANVRASVQARGVDLAGYEVVLVDDIKTTGSTLAACCRELKGCGAVSIHVAVAAVADPQGMKFQRSKAE
ncbi:MAG: phosphoribosyltransferase family protein [Planctomycetota bacterium]